MDNKIKVEEDVDKPDWRLTFSSESRQKIVAKVEASLWKCISNPSPDKFQEIKDAAAKFEDKMFSIASSTEDYDRRITTKMLKVNKTTPTGEASSLPSNSSCSSQITDLASHSVQSQVRNQSKSSPVPMANQSQPTQQRLLLNNMENSMSSPGIQNSGNLVSLPLVTCLTDNPVANSLGQSCEMQITPGMSQTQNTFSSSQRQVHERQHLQQVVAQQHLQSQNQNQFVFQQQFQHPGMMKHRGNIQTHSMHPHDPQQQQHNLMQPIQTSSSQQQTQSPMVQSATQTGVVQNQQSSALQQHSQSVQWQQQLQRSLHEQQASMAQPIMVSSQQKQQLIGKQTDERNFQHNQPFGQPNSTMELQKQQRQKWLGQQTNSSSMQHQQQVMSQQNDISRFHQQTLGLQGNVSGLKQQQQFGNQSGVSNMQTHQQSMHSLHQAKSATHQQSQQTSSMLLSSPGKQAQSSRQQLMVQSQQQKQMQQQLALENKSNSFQRGALQHQNSTEWQRQLLQLQQGSPEPSSTSTDTMGLRGYSSVSGDVQDEVLNKVKFMMETYLPQLNEIIHRINIKLQQAKPEEIDILKGTKSRGEMSTFLADCHYWFSSIVSGKADSLRETDSYFYQYAKH
ncbi:mediator of RNA polymerase II transcription subunit 15a-like [Papaver somniferum]|uniref:mediator of RNA polymerase II transcription subunit 15a-like n=1 Tax=Papaver somniferum TaxID=3469 RepID=UPI000E702555|nr:mediator of RNA polymerase II transcription subunit 15a-like [Papaver somniferum]